VRACSANRAVAARAVFLTPPDFPVFLDFPAALLLPAVFDLPAAFDPPSVFAVPAVFRPPAASDFNEGFDFFAILRGELAMCILIPAPSAPAGMPNPTRPQSGSCKNSLRPNQQIICNENRRPQTRAYVLSSIAEKHATSSH
jgi:hypothetical protein